MEVVQVLAFASTGALVVRPSLPEHEHVVGVAVGNAVLADIVNFPAHTGCLEQVEDDRIIEHPVTPDAVGCDPSRRAGGEVEAIGPCGSH